MVFMISQPMNGLSDEQILAEQSRVIYLLQSRGHSVINTFFKNEYKLECDARSRVNCPLFWLGKSFEKMSECDGVYFVRGWSSARGCRIEYQAACEYGMYIINEEKTDTSEEVQI